VASPTLTGAVGKLSSEACRCFPRFKWAEGWNLRFGLVKLNPETQERTLRRSGELYGVLARLNAINDELMYRYTPELFETLFL
jgi:beta-glucosidase